jgi:flagellar assembly protein FliH
MTSRAFVFETEFTPGGDVVGAPASRFVARTEAEAQVVRAQAEAEARTRQSAEARGYAAVDQIVAHLAPVSDRLAAISADLRREAAELALAAARAIAGRALDRFGAETAAEAVCEVVAGLRDKPTVIVSVPPEALPAVERRVEHLQRAGRAPSLTFLADSRARPGDWRVEWAEGSASFSQADVEASVEAAIRDRLSDPVEPQLELFSA